MAQPTIGMAWAIFLVWVRFFFIMLFALVPAILLGGDFGWSVGIGYFVVAAAVLSINADSQDLTGMKSELAGVHHELQGIREELQWHVERSAVSQVIKSLDSIESSVQDMKSEIAGVHEELQWHKDLSTASQVIKSIDAVATAFEQQKP